MARCGQGKSCGCACGVAGLLTAIFLILSSFGAAITSRFTEEGLVARCPILGATGSMCMDVTGHLQIWRDAFLAAPQSSSVVAAVGLLGFWCLGFALLGKRRGMIKATMRALPLVARSRFRHPGRFDYLRLLFARGLLHPKVF